MCRRLALQSGNCEGHGQDPLLLFLPRSTARIPKGDDAVAGVPVLDHPHHPDFIACPRKQTVILFEQ
jgi:hypothetical protein